MLWFVLWRCCVYLLVVRFRDRRRWEVKYRLLFDVTLCSWQVRSSFSWNKPISSGRDRWSLMQTAWFPAIVIKWIDARVLWIFKSRDSIPLRCESYTISIRWKDVLTLSTRIVRETNISCIVEYSLFLIQRACFSNFHWIVRLFRLFITLDFLSEVSSVQSIL